MNQPENLRLARNEEDRGGKNTGLVVAAILSIGAGVLCIGLSLLPLLAAMLGFAGILADVGPAENREIGFQALWVGLPLLFLGLAAFVPPVFIFASRKSKA